MQELILILTGEPLGWGKLREEARPLFEKITIYEAELKKIQGISLGLEWMTRISRPKLTER